MATEAKTAQDLELERKQSEALQVNTSRAKEKGTRIFVGKTRGKNPVVISYESFDDSIPESLPSSVQEFVGLTKSDESTLLDYLIRGYNSASYESASDPLKEFVNPVWSEELQTQFRLVVRNYSRGANVPLEEAVNLIKPGFEKQHSASA